MTEPASKKPGTSRHSTSRKVENVLILQGGGSLGAFSCGVFKGLYENGIRFDTVGGTSIGAVNAAIICASKSGDPAADLEKFWLELADSSYQIIPDFSFPFYDFRTNDLNAVKLPSSVLNTIIFGVPGFFIPRWLTAYFETSSNEMPLATDWTYYYDHSPLGRTLEKYVDFSKLGGRKARLVNSADNSARLIATAVNVTTAEALVFDSAKMDIEPKHILASAAYSAYGFHWIQVDEDVYAWDGSLLSNTPLKEVIEASPVNDKNVYVVENYARQVDRLPRNRAEVVDRTRDIIFGDKTIYDLRAWKHISRQTELIEKLYEIIEEKAGQGVIESWMLEEVRKEYDSLVGKYGAEILEIHRISRNRMESPHILKNADFSPGTIRDLIEQGEKKAIEHVKGADNSDISDLLRILYV